METNRPPLIDEGTIIDVESAVEELREQLKPWYHKKNPGSSDAQYYTWFEESEAPRFKRIIDPVVLGVSETLNIDFLTVLIPLVGETGLLGSNSSFRSHPHHSRYIPHRSLLGWTTVRIFF